MIEKCRDRHPVTYTDEVVESVRAMHLEGKRICEIHRITGISEPHICELVHLKKRKKLVHKLATRCEKK